MPHNKFLWTLASFSVICFSGTLAYAFTGPLYEPADVSSSSGALIYQMAGIDFSQGTDSLKAISDALSAMPFVFDSGNVGIGRTPGYDFDVAGQANADEVCINENCRSTWPAGGTGTSLWSESGSDIYYNDGNVGIGTGIPSYLLEIHDSAGATAFGISGTGGDIFTVESGGYSSVNIGQPNMNTSIDMYGQGTTFEFASDTDHYDNFRYISMSTHDRSYSNQSLFDLYPSYVRLSSRNTSIQVDSGSIFLDGYVGIGTENPAYSLDVSGQAQATGFCIYDGDTSDCISAWPVGGSDIWQLNAQGIHYNSGNVGIGDNTPDSPLTVYHTYEGESIAGDMVSSIYGFINSTTTFNSITGLDVRLEQVSDSLTNGPAIGISADISDLVGSGPRYAGLFMGGNVGIGTENPDYPLDVNGQAQATGFCIYDGEESDCIDSWSFGGNGIWQFNGNGIHYNNANVGIGDNHPDDLLTLHKNCSDSANDITVSSISADLCGSGDVIGLDIYLEQMPDTSIGANVTGVNVNIADAGSPGRYAALFNGGSVGIGTETPTALLHVYTYPENNLLVATGSQVGIASAPSPLGGSLTVGQPDTVGAAAIYVRRRLGSEASIQATGPDTENQHMVIEAGSGGNIYLGAYHDGNVLLANNSDYVGIGTTDPQSDLHIVRKGTATWPGLTVEGDDSAVIRARTHSAGAWSNIAAYRSRGTAAAETVVQEGDILGIFSAWGHDGTGVASGSEIMTIVDGPVSLHTMPTRILFRTEDTTGDMNTNMTIKSAGQVGIGIENPLSKNTLHVNRSDGAGIIKVSGNVAGTGTDAGLWLSSSSDQNGPRWGLLQSGDGQGHDLKITTGSGAKLAIPMVITSGSGHVGIGTITPRNMLDVDGMIQMSEFTLTPTCDAVSEGAISYRSNHFYGCNGSSWLQLD